VLQTQLPSDRPRSAQSLGPNPVTPTKAAARRSPGPVVEFPLLQDRGIPGPVCRANGTTPEQKQAAAPTKVACPGRRIHDLRHTAACLWLAKGVDPVTVQAWLGHASIATTNIYLHYLGSSADRAGLDRLNAPGGAGGAPERRSGE